MIDDSGNRFITTNTGGSEIGSGPSYRIADIRIDGDDKFYQYGYWHVGGYPGNCAFSHDDCYFYAESHMYKINIFNAVNYEFIRSLSVPGSRAINFSVSPDGKTIVGVFKEYYDNINTEFLNFSDIR